MKKMSTVIAMMLFAVLFTYTASADKIDDIIAKNIKAHGGEKSLKEVKSTYAEMEMSVMGMSMPMKVWAQGEEKSRVEMSVMGQSTITVINGNKGWVKMGGQVQELEMDQLEQQKSQNSTNNPIATHFLLDYKAKGITITHDGSEDVNGKDCDVLKVVMPDKSVMSWFIDKKTGLEAKMQIEVEIPEGEDVEEGMPTSIEVFITDFMTLDGGIIVAKTMETQAQGMPLKINFNKVELNPTIAPSIFEQPK